VEENFKTQRIKLFESLARRGYITNPKVLAALKKVRREAFLPPSIRSRAYEDCPQSIGEGQTISAPHMVAIMSNNLEVKENDRILEIGTGSGYQAAVLAELAPEGEVYTIERIPSLAEFAQRNLKSEGYENVTVVVGDGTLGLPDKAPFDRIMVTAAAPKVPESLIKQLVDGGRLLIPVGGRWHQELLAIDKVSGKIKKSYLGGCIFVPLIGVEGW